LIVSILIASFLSFFTFTPVSAADTFNLSYVLTEGGYQLELNPVNLYKGINLRVDTNIGKQYEIIQRIIQPLVSRDDPAVMIRGNFVVRGISGSNRFGNLRFSTGDIPVRSEDIIYVSDIAGDADNFSLVYGLINAENLQPGYYSGRISFTLNPVSSSQQQVTKILEVYVSITNQGQVKPRIEISSSSGSRSIILNPKKEKNLGQGEVFIKINSTAKKQFSIIQFMPEPMESEDGNILDNEAVNFIVKNAEKGTSVNTITALTSSPLKIYASGIDGSADNYLVITYILGDLQEKKSGKYKSRMQYFWEEAGVQTKIDNLELVIDNERIFNLIASPADQKYEIEFRDLKPLGQPKASEVILEVASNTGKPYQISQEISSGLVNKDGVEITAKYFTLRTENINAKGNLKFLDKQEVKKGNTILFVSDSLGTPVKIKVIYELTTPMETKAGDYSANVTYSLLEM
ncbi:MAG: hypothetical protein Q7S42_00260, partial [Candidatus Omnitrophota bacterium]|nr:hypothetical protein [Candidatus Omnitrophota bacterium]